MYNEYNLLQLQRNELKSENNTYEKSVFTI